MSRAHATSPHLATQFPPRAPALAETGVWEIVDGVLFSIVSSLVLWSIIFTSVYNALN